METVVERKTAAVAKVQNGATAILYTAIVDGVPTEAQIETGRNALTATLEIVGAANTSAYLLRHKKIELSADESLLLTIDSTYSKISPDPLPDAAETSLEENAAAIDETVVEPEASEA